jgi:hypothetical protein
MREFLRPVETVAPRPTDPNSDTSRYVRSYLWMRVFVGALGVALPFLLVGIDGLWFDRDASLRDSLSAYYYSGVGDLFVGALCAIGVFLLTYKVAERNLDNTLSLVAGIAAACVALFPTEREDKDVRLTPLQDELGEGFVGGIHFFAAGVFIVSLAVISFYFGKREGARDPVEGKRSPKFWQTFHWACAAVIGLALVWIVVTWRTGWGPNESLLYGEAVSVLAFGVSWLWKGLEVEMLRKRPAPRVERAVSQSAS